MKKETPTTTKGELLQDKIPFYELPKLIKMGRLNFDGDKNDLRLHTEEMFRWGAKGKRDYTKCAKAIDAIEYKGNGWQIYAWYDVSGFDYWMKKMQETNYIQITISFDTVEINRTELDAIEKAIDSAIADAEALENKYNYDPDQKNYDYYNN